MSMTTEHLKLSIVWDCVIREFLGLLSPGCKVKMSEKLVSGSDYATVRNSK